MEETNFGLGHNLRKKFGEKYIPDNHFGIVYRYGHFDHIIGPGYHRLKSFVETLQGIVDMGGHRIPATVNLHSSDGMSFTVNCGIVYKLNPFYFSTMRHGKEKLANFVKMNCTAHKKVVQEKTSSVVRSTLGRFTSAALCNGANLTSFQEEISETLTENLLRCGYPLIGQISLTEITPPLGLAQKRQDNLSRQELIQVLQSIPSHLQTQIFRAEFLNQLAQMNGNVNIYADFDTMPHPEPDAPRTQYRGSNGRSPQPPRSNSQSTYWNQ